MAHMTKEPFTPFAWAFTLLAAGSFNSHARLVDGGLAAAALVGTAALGYTHYVTSVIAQVCEFLNIRCLSIKQASF